MADVQAEQFDVIVIGGGSGGSGFSRRAAGYGKKVVIIDRGVVFDDKGNRLGAGIGGTCVNVGCVPKKLMFNAAHHREMMHGKIATAPGNGYTIPEEATKFDWAGFKARRDAEVHRLNGIYLNNWKKAGIEVVMGVGSFASAREVVVNLNDGGVRKFTAPHICIAVGGVPSPLGIPGEEHTINSDQFFALEKQPKKAAILGAGYIAVEMAGIFAGLGTEATLLCRGDTVLRRGFDPFIVDILMNELKEHGPELVTNATPESVVKEADGTLTLKLKDGRTLGGFDCVLSAIGRVPVTGSLGLDKTSIELERGYIKVDKYENTTEEGVYAIGDATTSGYSLTPVAIAAGRRLGDRLFGNEPRARLEYSDIATVVFSHPPIGTVGLTEPQAREQFGDENIIVRESKFSSMTYVFNAPEGKVKTGLKLVLRLPEQTVVGLHLIGPSSDEMLQGFAVAVKMGATLDDFEASVAIHPTIAEEVVTFGGWGQIKDASVPGGMRPRLPPKLRDEPLDGAGSK